MHDIDLHVGDWASSHIYRALARRDRGEAGTIILENYRSVND